MKKYFILLIVFLCLLTESCNRDFLEERPDKALLVPETIVDFQNLLDDFSIMNKAPGLHIISCDDRYIKDDLYATLPENEKNAYLWEKEINVNQDWTALYKQVLSCNITLEGMDKIQPIASAQSAYNNVKGSALFYRAYAFFQLAEIFALPYDALTAEITPGILLRLKSDVNDRPSRATLAQTYNQITNDLKQAATLLPNTATIKTRPNAPAALGLLARVYLAMEKYDLAYEQANNSLIIYNKLLDYNSLAISATANTFPVVLPNGNDEVLFSTGQIAYSLTLTSTSGYIDRDLYGSYDSNDLRKVMYFRDKGNGDAIFKASYNGNLPLSASGTYKNFSGIAVDEIYLIRAECNARLDHPIEAMNDLNTLLITRWKTGAFVLYSAVDSNDALKQILMERRKSLFSRGLRWTDLRRLNKDARFAITLSRTINGHIYTLSPNDIRYALPFPNNEISKSVLQNPR